NTADSGAGIYNANDFYSNSYDNSIIANNITGNDCFGGILTINHTLIEDSSCDVLSNGTDNLTGDPSLGALTGSPAYFPLLDGSIAIDAGDNMLIPNGVVTDQAGNTRIAGGIIDLGSFEAAFTCPAFPYTVPDGDVTALINAINCANSLEGGGVINLGSSVYTLTTPESPLNIDNGLPVIVAMVTIHGNGATIERSSASGTPGFRLFQVASGSLTLDNLTLQGASNFEGAAIYNDGGTVTVSDVTFSNNMGGGSEHGGGAIANVSGTMTLTRTTLNNNTASYYNGGAVWNDATLTVTNSSFTGNVAGEGGSGIYNSGTLSVTNTTFYNNDVSYWSAPDGGTIWSSGTLSVTDSTFIEDYWYETEQALHVNGGTAAVTNSTITNAGLNSGAEGVHVEGGSVTLSNVTISSRAGIVASGGALSVNNSIVAHFTEYASNCEGTGATFNHSLVEDGSCGVIDGVNGNKTGDPMLGLLLGSPAYFILNVGSPAIDAGDNALIPDGVVTDQAGGARILNDTVDMGAFEYDATSPTLSIADISDNEGTGDPTTFSFIVSLNAPAPAGGVSFDITTADDTATVANDDYVAQTLTAQVIPEGSTSFAFDVTVNGDYDIEDNETLTVSITHIIGASEGDTQATALILNDDQDPGFWIERQSDSYTAEDGSVTGTISIYLTAKPKHDVVLELSSDDATEGVPDLESLTFTPDNWQTPQLVSVVGVDDSVHDDLQHYVILIGPAASDDPRYDGLDPYDLDFYNIDDDPPDIIVDPTFLFTSEDGASATFTVVLHKQPTADVTIDLHSSDLEEGSLDLNSLTFTPENWDVPQTVTVTGVDDAVIDGQAYYAVITDPAVSEDPAFDGVDADDVQVVNNDNDAAGVIVDPPGDLVTTEEGGTATFTVTLNSPPTGEVFMSVNTTNFDEGVPNPFSLTFTPENWDVPQTVTVTGADDFVVDGSVDYAIVLSVIFSGDFNFGQMEPYSVSVSNTDDDLVGFTVEPTSGLETTESGGAATFTIRMNTQPASGSTTTINLSSSNAAEGIIEPPTLTFSDYDFNFPHQVTIFGVDDEVIDGDTPYTILTSASVSDDPTYDGINPDDVSVTNLNDDGPDIRVDPIGVNTTEDGGTGTFTVVLRWPPLADVTIALSSSNPAEGTVDPASLTFTSNNWDVPQTVTVTGVDDGQVTDGSASYTIITSPAVSDDTGYSGLDALDVNAVNDDNDQPGVNIDPREGLVTTEAGGTATFTMTLNTQPTGNVTLGIFTGSPEGTIDPAFVTFTSENWDVAQTVTVTGVDDPIADGDVLYFVQFYVSASDDPVYQSIYVESIGVTSIDDETGGQVPTEEPPPSAPGIPAQYFLCSNLSVQSTTSMTGAGGILNVHLGDQSGNAYCHMITQNGSFLSSPAEIGIQSVLDLGVIQAVDISGLLPNGVPVIFFDTPVHVCLRGMGEVLFLNAAHASRTVERLQATVVGDYLCVDIPNAGTVVLVRSTSGLTQPPPAVPVSTPLNNCQVTTTDAPINLRAEPNTDAAILAKLPYDLTLMATARVPGWYRVIYLDGQGWISDRFASALGDCNS
ncbi:MAG: choice-of-anchor Q domain-containing protein, partial [Chloroflexota bacterium]